MILTLTRNPPSYFLKRDGGFAYVISKPKKQKQVSTLQELVFIFIDNIFWIFGSKALPAFTSWQGSL